MERYTPGGVPIYDGDAFGWSMRQGILNSPTHIAQRGYAIGFRQGAATVPAGGGGSSDILAGKTMSEHPTVGQTTAAVKTVWRALGGSFTTAAAALALLVLPVSGDQYADTALLDSLRGDVDRVVTNVKGPQIVSDAAAVAAAHTDATAERLRAEIASATNGIPESVDAAAGTAHSELLAAKAGLRAEIASATNGLPESISATETALRGEIASATNGIPESVSAAKAGLRAEIASATNGLRGVLDLATYRETGTGEWTPDPIPPSGAKEYAPRGSPSFSPASSNWAWTVEVRVGGVVASTYDAVTGPVPGEDSGTRLLFSDPRGEGPSFYAERARGYAVTGRIATEAYVDSKAVRTNEVQDIARSEIAPATGAVYQAMIDYVNLHGPTGSVSKAEATNIAEAVVGPAADRLRQDLDYSKRDKPDEGCYNKTFTEWTRTRGELDLTPHWVNEEDDWGDGWGWLVVSFQLVDKDGNAARDKNATYVKTHDTENVWERTASASPDPTHVLARRAAAAANALAKFDANGNLVADTSGKGLSSNDYTDADKAEVAKVKDKADEFTAWEFSGSDAEEGFSLLFVVESDCWYLINASGVAIRAAYVNEKVLKIKPEDWSDYPLEFFDVTATRKRVLRTGEAVTPQELTNAISATSPAFSNAVLQILRAYSP